MLKISKPENIERVETGSIQFDDDWPGVFIRGDNASYYCLIISQYLDKVDNPLDKMVLKELCDLLSGCVIGPAQDLLKEISIKTLHSIDESMENFKNGVVSDAIELDKKD